MMTHKLSQTFTLAAALLASTTLLGCQMASLVPTAQQSPPSSGHQAGASDLREVAPASGILPEVEVIAPPAAEQAQAAVTIAVKWPDRPQSLQAIPWSANSLRVRITPRAGGEVVYDDLIGRPGPGDAYYAQVISRQYMLKKDVAYQVEVAVYRERVADVTASSEAIASTRPPAEVTLGANENKALKLVLDPHYVPTMADASYAAGSDAIVTLTGSGFGTDPTLLQVEWARSTWDRVPLEIVQVTDTALQVKMPDSGWNWYSGPLTIHRDGIKASGNATLTHLYYFDQPGGDQLKVKDNSQLFCVLADRPFRFDVNRSNGQTITHLAHTLKVTKRETQEDVTAAVFKDGKYTLPEGSYLFTLTSGKLTNSFEVDAGTFTWSTAAVPSLTVSPYYISADYLTPKNPNYMQGVNLAGYSLTVPGGSAYFAPYDFDWSYGTPGIAAVNLGHWDLNYRRLWVTPTQTAGSTTMTGTLRFDRSKTINFTVHNVKIAGFNLDTSTNPEQWNTAWTGALTEPVIVPLGGQARVRVKSVSLTNGSTKSVFTDSVFGDKLSWSSRLPGTMESAEGMVGLTKTYSYHSSNSYTDLVITGEAPGVAEIQVEHVDDPTRVATFSVKVQ